MSAVRALVCALVLAGVFDAQAADPKPYRDEARGFVTVIPDGWTDFAGGLTTFSTDKSVSCTITVSPNPRTANMTQDEVNATLMVYTSEFWRQQFFQGGVTGNIELSGTTRLEAYDAPWAKGNITYPGRAPAKFTVLMVQGPGKIVSGTCTGEPSGYLKHENLYGIGKVLNYLRPIV
jgi:hypothetical protein